MKTTTKAERLRQKMAQIQNQLKAAEAAEREQKRAAEKREQKRAERSIVAAASTAGLLALSLDREKLENEFRALTERLRKAQSPCDTASLQPENIENEEYRDGQI